MSQVSHIDIEVRPSQNYQTVGFTTRVVFDPPVSFEEAKFEADLAYAELESIAIKRVKELGEQRGATIAHPMEQSGSPVQAGAWREAIKPNGAGTFKFLPTSALSKSEFISKAEALLPSLGLDPTQVVVFDDRGGDRGIESGEKYYCAGKVKARSDSQLLSIMDGKSIVANIDFDTDGGLRMSLSRDGKTATQAMKIAGQMQHLDAVPF